MHGLACRLIARLPLLLAVPASLQAFRCWCQWTVRKLSVAAVKVFSIESNGINHWRGGGVVNLLSIIINLMPPILVIFNLHVNLSTAGIFFFFFWVRWLGPAEEPWAHSSIGYCTGWYRRCAHTMIDLHTHAMYHYTKHVPNQQLPRFSAFWPTPNSWQLGQKWNFTSAAKNPI